MALPQNPREARPPEATIEELCRRVELGRSVRARLPGRGIVAIDRALPFLFVHRRLPGVDADGTERLIRSEAAFLIAPGEREHHGWTSRLVERLGDVFEGEFGAFLLIEVWCAEEAPRPDSVEPLDFRVEIARPAPPQIVSDTLVRTLRNIKLQKRPARVECGFVRGVRPGGLPPLLSSAARRDRSFFSVGLEVEPVYRDAEHGKVFPLTLRSLRRQLSRSLRRTVHQFALSSTTHAPPSYLALGRRGFLRQVFQVDQQLSEFSESFDFLLHVTPVQLERCWGQFRRHHYERTPVFTYRPLPADPIALKRRLLDCAPERIEDPALEQLYRDKQLELDRKLTMLLDRGTERFFHGSMQLYGAIDASLSRLAREVLTTVRPRTRDEGVRKICADEFATLARREIDRYRRNGLRITSRVEVRDDIYPGLLVSNGDLLIGKGASFRNRASRRCSSMKSART